MKKQWRFVFALAAFAFLAPFPAFAESWPVRMWKDVQENSSVNLGDNVAWASYHDFVYGDTLTGMKSSLWNYRWFHLEYGMAQRVDGTPPMSHTLGAGIYLQPLLKWAAVPKKWEAIKKIVVGPFTGYDFRRWRAGIQAHLMFSLRGKDSEI